MRRAFLECLEPCDPGRPSLLLTGNNGGGGGGGGGGTNPQNHLLWVSLTGSDATGDGSINKPYASYAKAAAVAVAGGASAAAPWSVLFTPGVYAANVALVAWVNPGAFPQSVVWTGTVTLDPVTFTGAAVQATLVQNLELSGNVTLDASGNAFTGDGGVSFVDVFFDASVVFTYTGAVGGTNGPTFFRGVLNSDMTLVDTSLETNSLDHYGDVLMTNPNNVVTWTAYGGAFQGATLDSSGGGHVMSVVINGASNANAGGTPGPGRLSLIGIATTYRSTVEGIPNTVTLGNSALPPVLLSPLVGLASDLPTGVASTSGSVATSDGTGRVIWEVSSPHQLPGLQWWLRADLGVHQVAGVVSQWDDQSGSADANRNVVQAVALNRPTLNVADAAYNAQNTISFASAVPQWLSMVGLWSIGAIPQPYTLIVVGNSDAAATVEVFVGGHAANTWYAYQSAAAIPNYGVFVVTNYVTVQAAVATKVILANVFRDPLSTLRDSENTPETTANGNTGALPQLDLGGAAGVGAGPLNGKIAEVILYSRALQTSEIAAVQGYLSRRYAITLGP